MQVEEAMKQKGFLVILLIINLNNITATTHPEDVAALKGFRRSIEDPKGKLGSWGTGDPCDDGWDGVFCEVAKDTSHVVELHVLSFNLAGKIAPEAGNLSNLQILNAMWNNLSGSIPSSLGKLQALKLLLLNGNQLTGTIPEELGNLVNMNRLQIDENQLSGPVPSTFANLISVRHLHMNNNSLSGSIPPELGRLPKLLHLLLDNNKLTGRLPSELSNISVLQILQLDNNHFEDTIPSSYGALTSLLKLSLRNCSLTGIIPDLSRISLLEYIDLSHNLLDGELPVGKTIRTIDVSDNRLTGRLSSALAEINTLQVLSVEKNQLSGPIPAAFVKASTSRRIILNFQDNLFSGFSSKFNGDSANIWLAGNAEICKQQQSLFCLKRILNIQTEDYLEDNITNCDPTVCVPGQSELLPALALEGLCRCASPIRITCRLKSPGFTFFEDYHLEFEIFMASALNLSAQQVHVASYEWEAGPRLLLSLKLFSDPIESNRNFNTSEVRRLFKDFSGWRIRDNPVFGPRELLAFEPPFGIDIFESKSENTKKVISKGAIVGIVLTILTAFVVISGLTVLHYNRKYKCLGSNSQKEMLSRRYSAVKIEGVKAFGIKELCMATKFFSKEIGRGGSSTVYRGTLVNGIDIAIKRTVGDSYKGEKEFFAEIQLLSRIHHRNLVSLVGYCTDSGEQILVYEYVSGGTLQERLSPLATHPLSFMKRIYVALGAARGILYLHTEVNPPIIHRDVKASNILIGEKDIAKVADFGLSRQVPHEEEDNVEGGLEGHVSTVIKGTPGYLDPEYFLTRKLSDKSDIYSFGVVLLELVTGKEAIYEGKNLVREAKLKYDEGLVLSIVDYDLGSYTLQAVEELVRLALACTNPSAVKRPSMREVVRNVEKIWQMASFSSSDCTEDYSEALTVSSSSTSSSLAM